VNGPLRRLAGVVAILFASLLASTTWVQFVDADSLDKQPTNSRTLYKEYGRERGPLLVGNATPIAQSVPVDDQYKFLRKYPGNQAYSHITGFYSIVYGPTGMERAVGDLLSGTSDQLFYRRIGDLLTGEEPQGASVELTIDPKVQSAAWKALGDQRGAVVALDPKTGAVLAMVSKPAFDPNVLASHDRTAVIAARKKLLADPTRPLEDRSISSRLYPPGSVFKLVTAAAALSSGRWDPQTELPGPAVLDLPQTTVGLPNYSGGACGANDKITLTDALRISCNTAFGFLGLELGAPAVAEQAQKFGFGQQLRIPLDVTQSSFPANANPPQTAQSAIGQFDVRVTPMQVAMVSAGIANDGIVMRPNLVKTVRSGQDLKVIDTPEPERLSEAVPSGVADQLTAMMLEVVRNGTGTRAQISGVDVAGKSGTAQQGDAGPPHAWFTAFAPADDPQVAVAVVIEDGGGLGDEASGGRLAAPVAQKVMRAVLDK
jgi:peptidoglycan glycosyltransferase